MKTTHYCYMLVILAVLALTACEQPQPEQTFPEPEELMDREMVRIEHLTSGDYDSLDSMLSSSMTYTHSNAQIDTREEYMQSLRSGDVVYRSLEHREPVVRFITPDVGMINGVVDVIVTVDDEDIQVLLRVTIVYVKVGGEWLFEAWHSTSVPDPE